jgi:hypothetical protein
LTSTPVAPEVSMAETSPVENACGTSAYCTVVGTAPISSASREVAAL